MHLRLRLLLLLLYPLLRLQLRLLVRLLVPVCKLELEELDVEWRELATAHRVEEINKGLVLLSDDGAQEHRLWHAPIPTLRLE